MSCQPESTAPCCSRALRFTFRFLWLQIQFHLVSHTALKQRTCWKLHEGLHQDVSSPPALRMEDKHSTVPVLCSERAGWDKWQPSKTRWPHFLTYDTERLSGKFEPPPPPSVSTAAASSPYPHNVLHSKHHDGHNFLWEKKNKMMEVTMWLVWLYIEYMVHLRWNDTHQDVQGTLRAVFELFDGGKDWQYETGEDQEEAEREEMCIKRLSF